MNKSEFITLREALGLSQTDLANLIGVNSRSVRNWESLMNDKYSPPQDVVELLENLDAYFDLEVARLLRYVKNKKNDGNPISLYRYKNAEKLWLDNPKFIGLPTSCHAAMLFRQKKKLVADGFQVNILCIVSP